MNRNTISVRHAGSVIPRYLLRWRDWTACSKLSGDALMILLPEQQNADAPVAQVMYIMRPSKAALKDLGRRRNCPKSAAICKVLWVRQLPSTAATGGICLQRRAVQTPTGALRAVPAGLRGHPHQAKGGASFSYLAASDRRA